ncbi:MAG: hypothetical protein ABIY70_22090 [Capsulimonas sp.]|uniref:hypothetical protein n=1 Tax=Capsulimonas sp. TaxID=2494211 RepID=UPI003263D0D7
MTNTLIQRMLTASVSQQSAPWFNNARILGAAIIGIGTLLPVLGYSANPPAGAAPAQLVNVDTFTTSETMMDIDGDKIQFSGSDLTPNTPVTVNGVVGRFGDLTPKQQQMLRVTQHPQGGDVSTVTSRETMMDINGDKIQFSGSDLTPNTPVKVNGVVGRFGDLSPKQQQMLRATANPNDIKSIIASIPAVGANAKVHFFTTGPIVLDINGSKIELSIIDLKPDTPVKVNGVTGLFGALTPQQQQQIREQIPNTAIFHGALSNTPLTPEMVSTIVRSAKASNLPADVKAKFIADAMAQAAAKP